MNDWNNQTLVLYLIKMANKICRCTILAFIDNKSYKKEGYYNNWDLENAIQYCQEYIDEGYTYESMDNFNLKDFIEWAKKELNI